MFPQQFLIRKPCNCSGFVKCSSRFGNWREGWTQIEGMKIDNCEPSSNHA